MHYAIEYQQVTIALLKDNSKGCEMLGSISFLLMAKMSRLVQD